MLFLHGLPLPFDFQSVSDPALEFQLSLNKGRTELVPQSLGLTPETPDQTHLSLCDLWTKVADLYVKSRLDPGIGRKAELCSIYFPLLFHLACNTNSEE